MDLFYIGDYFYSKSGTMMSSTYHVGTHQRSDWGFVQSACRRGEKVSIRPATDNEMTWAIQELAMCSEMTVSQIRADLGR